MCGEVSFKRGDSFYRTDKVRFVSYQTDECKAIVTGTEEFEVIVSKRDDKKIEATCNCPKLVSYDKDCQHIAAVLVAIYDHQRLGTVPLQHQSANLSDGLFSLFSSTPTRPSSHQRYFENRTVLQTQFTFCHVNLENGQDVIAVDLSIEHTKVKNIREFLTKLKDGTVQHLTSTLTFDQRNHCFQKESDAVLQQLILINQTKSASISDKQDGENSSMLIIPAPAWEVLVPLLQKIPNVLLKYHGQTFSGLHVAKNLPPLQFNFEKGENDNYQLSIRGFESIIILDNYQSILHKGKVYQLEYQDSKRLSELKQMLALSRTKVIPIVHEQINYFLEKVVPGLKRIGNVNFPEEIRKQFLKTPLIAKLYLDRVNNRLLAGLEFQYEHLVINPLENRDVTGNLIVRDVEKEEEILQIMDESSFSKTEGGYYIHNEQLEYEFLYHQVPKLKKLVQLYATTAVRTRIFRGNKPPQIRVKVKKERTNWLEFKFELDGLAENQIREVLEALEEKRKYYRLRNGSLFSLETKEFEEIQRYLRSPLFQDKDLSNGLSLPIEQCLELLDEVDSSKSFKLEDSFRGFLETIKSPGLLEFEVPKSVDSILKKYQKQGFQWMKTLAYYGFGGILADDMGLGKTLQSITFILSILSEIRNNRQLVLVVCPSSLTYNWFNEFMKFAPVVKTLVLDGSKADRVKLQKELIGIDVVITSYPLLRKDIKWYESQTFHTIFFDEAQAFKNPTTQTARAVKKVKANHRFALTGTPVENSLEELWSIYHVVFPELFHGLKDYSHLSRKTIARRIRPFLLRRMKEDVLSEFPEKMESLETAELHAEQKKLYAAYLAKLRHDTLKHLDKDTIRKNRIKILAGLTRLRQICCHPALFVDGYKGSSAKFEQLLKIIEEAKLSGRRVLIFSQFTKMLGFIGNEFSRRGLPFFYLDGHTPAEERVKICNRFNNGERSYFLISLKAGGTGLNLMGADTVILYDTWWNPAVEEQAADRAHRIGQKNTVQVIKLIARGTIEEKINELQDKKRHLIEEVIDSEDNVLSRLTEDDIREILKLN